jgi:hypothetical protein
MLSHIAFDLMEKIAKKLVIRGNVISQLCLGKIIATKVENQVWQDQSTRTNEIDSFGI